MRKSSSTVFVHLLIVMILVSLLCGIVVTTVEGEGKKQYVYAATATTTAASYLPNFNFAAAGDWACNSNTTNLLATL
jgi:hypothetical protein